MATFKFGELRVDVRRMEQDPLHQDSDFYAVRVSHADTFLEIMVKKPRLDRTAGTYYAIAMFTLDGLYLPAKEPEQWAAAMQQIGQMNQEEIDATLDVASNLALYIDEAVEVANSKLFLYEEHFEKGVGPYDPSLGRK